MVLLLVFLLSLCINFDAKSMHDTIWAPIKITTNQAWPTVKIVKVASPQSETKSPSPVSPVSSVSPVSEKEEENEEDSSDLEHLAEQVAHATLFDEEESEPKEGVPEEYASKPLPYIVAWNSYDSRAHEALVEYLESKNPVDVCDTNGCTGLHLAVYYDDVSAVHLLLQHKANPNIRNKEGLTPLHMVAVYDRKNILRILLDYKDHEGHGIVDVDMPTYNGDTALHFAIANGRTTIAKRLLDQKAGSNLPNKAGQTARDYALMSGDQGLMNLFS